MTAQARFGTIKHNPRVGVERIMKHYHKKRMPISEKEAWKIYNEKIKKKELEESLYVYLEGRQLNEE